MDSSEVVPKIYQISYNEMVPERLYKWGSKTLLGRLITLLAKDPRRNVMIVNEIIRAVGAGRKIMLLSDRIEHLKTLKTLLQSSNITATVSFYIGGMKKVDRKMSEQADIILGTTAMAKEGLDIVELDTIFLVSPHGDVQQSIGRILREHPGKKEPIVVDLVDMGVPLCVSFAYKRLKQYRDLGYQIAKSI
jgi:superfamily II DNA or RNA helicase